jgi:PAS domain S-box-containing protein
MAPEILLLCTFVYQPPARAHFLLVLFVVLATAIGAVTYRYHLAQKDAIAREVHNQLLAIADSKVKQIVSWRAGKIGEARIILNSRFTLAGVDRFVRGRSAPAEEAMIRNWLDALCRELHYAGATLTDVEGRVILTRGRLFGSQEHLGHIVRELVQKTDVDLTDLHLEPDAPPHLGLNVPLRLEPGAPAFGALLIGLDPNDYLFPTLQQWPVHSDTAESLLVRREGDSVVFLSPLRKRSPAQPRLSISLSGTEIAAVRAVTGEEGTIEAMDYSGTPIYAAVQSAPGTSWRLVAKIDAEEVLAPLRWRSGLAGALAVALIFGAGAMVFVLWRREDVQAYRERYESELARREAAEAYDAERRAMNEELRRSVSALGESEARFRGAFEQVAVGMTIVSLDGHFLRANQRMLEVSGYSLEELRGMTYADLTHPDDRAADRLHIEPLLRSERVTSRWTKRHVRKGGEIIWVAITASVLRNPDEPQYLLGVVEDITAHVRAEEALRQSEERFRQVVERAPEGIIVITGNLEIRYANPAAVRMFGAESAGRLLGMSLLDHVHPEERETSRERCLTAVCGTPIGREDRRLLRVGGAEFPAEVHAGPIVYDGEPAALTFFRDATELKQAEEERSRLEQRLGQAQKMESVGRLAGGVAHDFNNHLTVINGYCDMLLEALDPADPLAQELGEIRAAGDRAAALTQQLLAFSRKQIVEFKPIVLNQVVEEFGRLVRRLIGDDIEVVTELDPALGVVMADRGQMHQVLMNLAVNARDAMPGGGRITVRTENEGFDEIDPPLQDRKPGPYILLTVRDSGGGMPPEILQKIFEPFFTTKPMGVGTGLGLSTVYGIVEQSGGVIRVASEVGKGTTFRIYLPRVADDVQEAPARAAAPLPATGHETVLVVEDQAEVRKFAMVILAKNGYRLLEASNGSEALALAAGFAGPIDLLVTDVVMPGMTGRELAGRLQASRPALKVLYISGYSSDVIARQGMLDVGVVYLSKPFAPVDLAGKVREILGRGLQ